MGRINRVGILTSGGDCAGLNAAIRAAAYRGIRTHGWQMVGIKDGTLGLMNRPLEVVQFDLSVLSGEVLRMGGTMLGTTNKGDPFAFPMPDGSTRDRTQDFIEGVRELALDALIAIGGDGSLRIVRKLCQQGNIPIVCIPKTIDNDVAGTEDAIGFSTAVDVAVEALDRLAPTAASHHRVMILEVMGRDVGHIALHTGIAGGADVILIPEIGYSMAGIAGKIGQVRQEGRNHGLIVVAEGVKTEDGQNVNVAYGGGETRHGGIGHYLSDRLARVLIGCETRITVLGHVQRGGVPSARDRMLATSFGVHAADQVAAGRFDRMVAWRDGGVVDVPLAEVAGQTRAVDPHGRVAQTARGLGIYLGDG